MALLDVPRLAAQLIVPRQLGTGARAADEVRRLGVGGVVALADVIPMRPAQVMPVLTATHAGVQRAMRESGRDWPAFIGIDQEGGPVVRIGLPLTEFPSVMALGATRDPALAAQVGGASGAQLRALGYTVVLAPSADVTVGPADPTIGTRSPGSDPQTVQTVAGGLLSGYQKAGILATLKHFPGHGSVAADTHLGLAVQKSSLAALRERDLRPFSGLAEVAPAIMTAHIQLAAVADDAPATLSRAVVSGLLRESMRYRGLIVTDALEMRAITDRYGAGEAAVKAVEAGCDVVLIPADPRAAITALTQAVASGRLDRSRLEESAARMVAALRHAEAVPPARPNPSGHSRLAGRLAAASITQISGLCGKPLVGLAAQVTAGDTAARAAFNRAAAAGGLRVGSGTTVALLSGDAYRAGGGERAGTSRAATADVVVALDRPYPLAASQARTALIATYGRTPATFTALVEVLRGKRAAGGRLPVAVGDHPVGSGCP